MSWRTTFSILGLACMLHGCGTSPNGEPPAALPDEHAATPLPPEDAATHQPPTGEILLATPPQGWVESGAMSTPALRMAEYGPASETGDELERITFEAQTGLPLPDPIEFVLAVSRDLEARCNHFEDINVASGDENGYPTSVRLMICPEFKDSPHGQVVMAKAIKGTDEFYVITRRLRVPPMQGQGQPLTAQDMAAWSSHLRAVQVCDTRSTDHPCPEAVTR